jgi:hypothetical protein
MNMKSAYPPLMICVIGFLVFARSLNNSAFLTNDDSVVRLSLIQNPANIPLLFTGAPLRYTNLEYRPVGFVALSLFKALVRDENTAAIKILLLLAHILTAVLLCMIFSLLSKNRLVSGLCATLFLVHPYCLPLVNNIENFYQLLGVCLVLGAILCGVAYIVRHKKTMLIAATLLFLTGLFTAKIPLVVLPLLGAFICTVFAFKRTVPAGLLWLFAGCILAALCYILVGSSITIQPATLFYSEDRSLMHYGSAALDMTKSVVFFLALCVVPLKKALFNFDLYPVAYLSVTFFAALVSALLIRICGRMKKTGYYAAIGAMTCLGFWYCALTVSWSALYENNATFWKEAVRFMDSGSERSRAEFLLGKSYYEEGNSIKAGNLFFALAQRTDLDDETRTDLLSCLAEIYRKEGQYENANYCTMEIVNSQGWATLSRNEEQAYDFYKTMPVMTRKVALLTRAWRACARQDMETGFYDWAEHALTIIYLYDPYNIECLEYLGRVYFAKGHYTAATVYYRKILNLDPSNSAAKIAIEKITTVLRSQG